MCTRCANGLCAQRRRTYEWHDHARTARSRTERSRTACSRTARLRTACTWDYIMLQAYQTLVSVDNFDLDT